MRLCVHAAERKQVLQSRGRDRRLVDDEAMREIGEKGGARDAWVETRFRFGTGITSVVPWHAPSPGGWASTLLGLPRSSTQQSALTNACAAYPVVEVLRFLGQAYDT